MSPHPDEFHDLTNGESTITPSIQISVSEELITLSNRAVRSTAMSITSQGLSIASVPCFPHVVLESTTTGVTVPYFLTKATS